MNIVVLLQLLLLVRHGQGQAVLLPEPTSAPTALELPQCSSDEQQVQCGQLPFDTAEAFTAYTQCCQLFEPAPLPPAAAAAAAQATATQAIVAASTPRPDLDLTAAGRFATPPDYLWSSTLLVNNKPASTCVAKVQVLVPTFTVPQAVSYTSVTAPQLTGTQIQRVKARGLSMTYKIAGSLRRAVMRMRVAGRRTAVAATSFAHPSALMSPAEVALMQQRLSASISPQTGARDSLLTGATVPPKFYRFNATVVWSPPVDTPVSWSPGPYAMAKVATKYGGWEVTPPACPANYPAFAPRGICGHISFVEMDGQMMYKQALAYLATKDLRYAQNAFAIANAWANTNKAWGVSSENGPLEAGWGIASMARSLEMLRSVAGFTAARDKFLSWFNTYLKPQMVNYVDVSTANAVKAGNLNIYGNWQGTIADAWMAVAVLSDDATLFNKASSLFTATTTNYFRWGRDPAYSAGRTLGECTETLRDVYHSLFGLGALLQTAETAFQQNSELFSVAGFALLSGMELHARIINAWDAGKREDILPPAMKFYDTSMPPPPAGTQWSFDIGAQLWRARKSDGTVVSTLQDGLKYIVGVKWLPTGWEIGYNHYAGRLGIPMPETAKLLSRYPIEHHEFHWGLGTLSHADTAYQLWRPGLSAASLC